MLFKQRHSQLVALTLLVTVALSALFAATSRAAQTYPNPPANTAIAFSGDSAAGPAAPYPSKIAVANLAGSITRVTVQLTGLSHSFPDSVDLLLRGPDGKQVLLMSDAGGNTALSGVNLTFADGAPALPNDGAIATGTYRPSNYAPSDTFPAPGPGALGASPNLLLSIFNKTNPNGEWQLFAMEDESGSTGAIAGWSLTLETAELIAEVGAAPATVNAGSLLEYDVIVRNQGTEAVADPTLTIDIPEGTTYSAAAPVTSPGWSCAAPAPAAASFTCTTASFASGAAATIRVGVLVDRALEPLTEIERTATITSDVEEANTDNNSASATTDVTTLADLQVVSVDAPATVNAGAEMTIAVAVRNNGPSNADTAAVTIPVPDNTTFVAVTAPAGWTCEEPDPDLGSEVVCETDVFGVASAAFSLRVKVDPALAAGSTVASAASIGSETNDTTDANDSGADTTAVTTLTDLAVTVTDTPDPVSAAANLTYEIVVTNNGPSNAMGATLSTAVRTGTTFVSLVAPEGWDCATKPAVGGIGPVSCANPSFGVTSATFRLTVRVSSGTPVGAQLSLTATAATATTDSAPANDSETETSTVTVNADLGVTIEGVPPRVLQGAEFAYTIKVNNSGPEPGESVTLTTATPANATFVSLEAPAGWDCTTPAVGAGGAITCTNPALDVATDTLVLTLRLAPNAPSNAALALTVTVESPTEDANAANNSATLTSLTGRYQVRLPLVRR
jgi:uncharacterized repeat protein (TIGR01451 family)